MILSYRALTFMILHFITYLHFIPHLHAPLSYFIRPHFIPPPNPLHYYCYYLIEIQAITQYLQTLLFFIIFLKTFVFDQMLFPVTITLLLEEELV